MSLDSAELGSRTSTAGIARGISASKINGHTPTPANANGHAPSAEARALEVQAKYMREREKRIRPDDKPIDVGSLDKFKQFAVDPWIDEGPPVVDIREVVPDRRCKVLILGTGFVGLTAAVRLLQSGIDVEEIRMVDTACNFGGTWYWNRYPGLMCDIESYIYMPLLEETGYMPKYKYSYDTELRDYANLIADQFKLRDKTVFQTAVRSATWDDVEKEWVVELRQDRRGHEAEAVQLRTEMFCIAGGIVHHPRIPNLAGLENFKGHSFHTARWDYRYTGGSPSDWNLMGLDDKRVGFVGTGATGIQAVTQLARNAKELYVFQRTPSAVDVREQQPTDPKWWSKYSSEKGWQRKRSENFCAHFVHPSNHPKVNLVDDGTSFAFTSAPPAKPSPHSMDSNAHLRRPHRRHNQNKTLKPRRIPVHNPRPRFSPARAPPRPHRKHSPRPLHRLQAHPVVPGLVQAALLPRRLSPLLQPAKRTPSRHRRRRHLLPNLNRCRRRRQDLRRRRPHLRHRLPLRGRQHRRQPRQHDRHRPARRRSARQAPSPRGDFARLRVAQFPELVLLRPGAVGRDGALDFPRGYARAACRVYA